MYITINDIIGKKAIDLSYPIQGKDGPSTCRVLCTFRPCSAEIAVVRMLSGNVQYWLQGPIEVLLKTSKKIVLHKGVYTDKEPNRDRDRDGDEISNAGTEMNG